MSSIDVLVDRLRDRRSRRVVFLSHCLLNENTRYLGGACRPGCVAEIVDQCRDKGIGVVQMPCPEERAWGGVQKRHMLRLHGGLARLAHGAQIARVLSPIAAVYSRVVFDWIARGVAAQIADYRSSGYTVAGVVAVDGSPSCGWTQTVDLGGALGDLATLDPVRVSVGDQNALVRRHVRSGRGLFIEGLVRALRRRRLDIPFFAHDLLEEFDGRPSRVQIP